MAGQNIGVAARDVPVQRNGVPLALPGVARFWGRQLRLVAFSLTLNGVAAGLAAMLSTNADAIESFRALVRWLVSGPALQNNPTVAIFGGIAALAAVFNSIGPIHSAHDAAIRFLHNIELCKQLSREIARANYAEDRPARKEWADNIRVSYRPKRRIGKIVLFLVMIFMVSTIAGPWLFALHYLRWIRIEVGFAAAMFAPLIFGHLIEITSMIWPGNEGFRLGESGKASARTSFSAVEQYTYRARPNSASG
jgi:hypothetical protein